MILLVWGGGCSKEEQPAQPVKKTKVVKSIKRPPIKKAKVSSAPKDVKAKPKKTKQTKAKPKKKVSSKVKTAGLKAKASKTVIQRKENKKKEGVGYYTVKKSDSLSSIAGREDVYRMYTEIL
jgi:LysM repeat protein